MADTFFWALGEYFEQNLPLNSDTLWLLGKIENTWMLLFDTFLYFNMKLINPFFEAIFYPWYNSHLLKKSLQVFQIPIQHHDWLSFQSLNTNVMIYKLKKLILEVSLDLKTYLNYSVGLYYMKKTLHLNSCCLFCSI